MNEPQWWIYFRDTAGTEDGATIARATGVTAPQVSRWKSSKNRPGADKMAQFARTYGRPPVEALVAAGYITATEAADVIEVDRELTDDQLVDEVRRRLGTVRNLPGVRVERGEPKNVTPGRSPDSWPAGWRHSAGDESGMLG